MISEKKEKSLKKIITQKNSEILKKTNFSHSLMEYQEKKYEALADFNESLMGGSTADENSIKYLNFKKGDLLISKAVYENGWIYGQLKNNEETEGFFPSNYVKPIEKPEEPQEETQEIEEKNEEIPENPEIHEIQEKKEKNIEKPSENMNNNKRKAGGSWMDFVKDIISEDSGAPPQENLVVGKKEISENDILNEALIQENYNSIIGYKKIRITNDPNQALKKRPNFVGNNNNPTPVLNNEFAMVPVKQQDPNSKAIRLLYHYFDYNKWIEEKNNGLHVKKAKPDAKKKKIKKKVLNLKL